MIHDVCSHCSNWESNNSEILRVLEYFFFSKHMLLKCIFVFQVTPQVLAKSWAFVYLNIFIWHAEKTILSNFYFQYRNIKSSKEI